MYLTFQCFLFPCVNPYRHLVSYSSIGLPLNSFVVLVMNSFRSCRSDKVLISPLFMKDIPLGIEFQADNFFIFQFFKDFAPFLLTCFISNEKSIILIFVSLYVVCAFSLTALKILSSSLILSNYIMIHLGIVFLYLRFLELPGSLCLQFS